MNQKSPGLKELIPPILILILVFGFSAVLLREGRLRDTDLARLGSLEAAAAVAEAVLTGESPVFNPAAAAAVTGWGVYTPEGSRVTGRGTAPERLTRPPAGAGVSENSSDGHLQSFRYMATGGPYSGLVRRGTGAGGAANGGGRRIIYIDWDMRAAGNPEGLRVTGVSGLLVLTILLLVLQQRSARRLSAYRREEAERRRLLQLGMAARTLTHEIRNPLGSIKARVALMRRLLPDGQKEHLDTIDSEVERLNILSTRVRDWLADPVGHPVSLVPAEIVGALVSRLSWPVDVVVSDEAAHATLRIDPGLFEASITNLLRNALDSQEDLPDAPPVTVLLSVAKGKFIIRVEDRGCGLPDEDSERLFDPFFTTKTHGSGVGLALAKQAVEAGGGRLNLEHRTGRGTSARIVLPLEEG